jgi:hypothetical protein
MTTAKTIAAVKRTKQFKALIDANFSLASSDRQLRNGTLVFQAKIGKGKRAKLAEYSITGQGAVISNKFVARRIDSDTPINLYREGLNAIADLVNKRLAA